MSFSILRNVWATVAPKPAPNRHSLENAHSVPTEISTAEPIGMIAGNGRFPFHFVQSARRHGHQVIAVCHIGEADPSIEESVLDVTWIKVGELGKIIKTFKTAGVKRAVMAGGINRVRLFGNVKLDTRAAMLMARLRSTKDDVVMRGVADELAREGIEIIPAHTFMEEYLMPEGVLTRASPTPVELKDIQVGIEALIALSGQDVGQLVVVHDGVITAVEAVEGSDRAILRGGELAGKGAVVVKFPKVTQDLRFDLPTVGTKTIETMIQARCRVLALKANETLVFDREQVLDLANRNSIAIVGCTTAGS